MELKNVWGNNPQENFFRQKVTLAAAPKMAYARIFVDTGYELFINGRFVAAVDEWSNTRDYNVRQFLYAGENQIAIHALNHGGHRGLAFELVVDGETVSVTNKDWKAENQEKWGWTLPDYNDDAWGQANELDLSAAGLPQWWTKPGSNPELIVPALDSSQFFIGAIPKTCASPYWTAKKPDFTPDENVVKLLGEDYKSYATTPNLPPIMDYAKIVDNTAETEGIGIRIASTERYTGPSFIVDFGRETVGFFRLRIRSDAAVSVRLHYGESIDEAANEPRREVNTCRMLTEEYRLFSGEHEFESRTRVGFRYVRVEFYDCAAPVYTDGFSVRTATYPVAKRGYFACSDADISKLWQMSARTLHYCMQEYYLDAIKRDRFLWTGDARLEVLFNYYLFADTDLFEFCWDELAKTQYPNGAIPSSYGVGLSMLWDYVAWYIIAFYDHYMYTGRTDFALKHIKTMERATDFLAGLADETGMINVPENPMGKLWMVELNAFVGYDPYLNWLYLRSLETAALFAEMAGNGEKANGYTEKADKIRPAVEKMLSDGELTKYFDATEHIQIQYEQAEQSVLRGDIDAMLARLRKYWVCMLTSNSDTVHEGSYRIGILDSIEEHHDEKPMYASFCHGWAAACTSLMPMGIAGIKIVEPGFKKVEIAPVTDKFETFSCAVPTPYGEIAVQWKDGKLGYVLPAGVTADIILHGKTQTVTGTGTIC